MIRLPDADEPGTRYRDAVAASLDALEIKYKLVTFDDVGCKDVTEFVERFPVEQLLGRMEAAREFGREAPTLN